MYLYLGLFVLTLAGAVSAAQTPPALVPTTERVTTSKAWTDRATVASAATGPASPLELWYRTPAPEWDAALRTEALAALPDVRRLRFAAQVTAIVKGGAVKITDHDSLVITKADSATLLIAGATNYPGLQNIAAGLRSADPAKLCADAVRQASATPYEKLKADHVAAHRALFDRVHLNLGSVNSVAATLPTDERLRALRAPHPPINRRLEFLP